MSPKVTVLMPVYNGEVYLKEAIESILDQTFTDFELLIINDCSKDNSLEIIKSYDDERINLVDNEENMGLSSTLNKGLEIARGEYIARMDQDDVSVKERLEKQVKFMDEHPETAICGSWARFFGEMDLVAKTPENHREISANMFLNSPMIHPSVILRKESLDKYNLRYNPEFRTSEDYDLWSRAIEFVKFHNIQEVLLNYRINPYQMTKATEKTIKLNEVVWKRQLSNLGLEFSEEDFIFHSLLMREAYIISNPEGFMTKSVCWLDKIINANKEKQIYDEKILLSLLKHKWYIAFKTIIDFDLPFGVFDIISSKQFKYLTLKNKLNFIYKLLKKRVKESK